LLFEFSPKSILPVALACITGAAGHHLLFDSGPVFPMPDLATPSNIALAIYSFIGLIIGFLSLGLSKIVYLVEDAFEKIPVHWMWWPALGGLAVGLIGYFAPHTLGVGYDNIISILSGTLTLVIVIRLCFFKFLSWAIALGSGTSGGTLAPLLTIGGAAGAVLGAAVIYLFPKSGITIPMAALIGMSAMFAGASRAYLTSITFAMEATMQSHALLPLLGACTASYLVSFFLMENTIMTEKIARRGVVTPDSYEADLLGKITVGQIISAKGLVLSTDNMVKEVRDWLKINNEPASFYIVVNDAGEYSGTVNRQDIFRHGLDPGTTINDIMKDLKIYVRNTDSVRTAVELMAKQTVEVLPVISGDDNKVIGVLSYRDILSCYREQIEQNERAHIHISLNRQRLKMLIKGKKLTNMN
jgi:chloride channel protein, CIC family